MLNNLKWCFSEGKKKINQHEKMASLESSEMKSETQKQKHTVFSVYETLKTTATTTKKLNI